MRVSYGLTFKAVALLAGLLLMLRYVRRHPAILIGGQMTTAAQLKANPPFRSERTGESKKSADDGIDVRQRYEQWKLLQKRTTAETRTAGARKGGLSYPTLPTTGTPAAVASQGTTHASTVAAVINSTAVTTTKDVLASQQLKRILLYTTLFTQELWPGLGELQAKRLLERCDVKACTITYDKAQLAQADAVVFHAVDLLSDRRNSAKNLRALADNRPVSQRWVFFMQESPAAYAGFESYNDLFNWTMTYRVDSDVFVPYSSYKPLDIWDIPPPLDKNYAEGKSQHVVWAVSNCGKFRDGYVKELLNYLPDITIFGNCASKFSADSSGKCNRNSKDCLSTLKSYKFILAFENCFCKDYISEKYWYNALSLGIVPVVMGANYDASVAIPGSFIDVSKFDSVESLANHLSYLDKNDTAYSEYFHWHRKYKRLTYDKTCELCRMLHDPSQPTRVHEDLGKYWSVKGACDPFNQTEKHLAEQLAKT